MPSTGSPDMRHLHLAIAEQPIIDLMGSFSAHRKDLAFAARQQSREADGRRSVMR